MRPYTLMLALFPLLFLSVHAEEAVEEPNPADDGFFSVILEKSERGEYEAAGEEEKAEWRRRFWAERDPTPTTDENQLEMEFQRRVLDAIREFHDKDGRFVFDARAEAWIRFGPPEKRKILMPEVSLHTGINPPREFWLYGDMILWFEDPRLNGHYLSGFNAVPSQISRIDQYLREDTGWAVDEKLEFEESFERMFEVENLEIDPVLARQMTEDGLHRWEETPQIVEYDYEDAEEFRFLFDVSCMKDVEGNTDVLIGFLIPLENFEFEVEGGIRTAAIQRRAAIYDEDYDLKARRVENMTHSLDPIAGTAGWIVTCDSFRVAAGPYHAALRVIDLRSGNHGIMKTEIYALPLDGDEVRISDILFAASVTRDTRGEGAFLRGDYRIVPRPIRIYTPGEDVEFYFELYNLATGPGGKGLYEIEYALFGNKTQRFASLLQGSDEGKLERGVSQSFRVPHSGSPLRRHIYLDTSNLPEDRYSMTIGVVDLVNNTTDEKTVQFVVKR